MLVIKTRRAGYLAAMGKLLVASLLTLSSLAAADPISIGFRVGGYGFRREGAPSSQTWDECRMNGLGLFANRAVAGPLFVEAGLDTYFSTNQAQPTDLPIDRQSALVSVAGGVQTQVTSWLRGYAQLGVGVELTRVAVPYGDSTIRENKVLPDGFFGIGGDIRIMRGTYLGAAMRTLVLGNFDYDPARLQMSNQWVSPPKASDVFSASPGLAAQGQFYLRRDL
jgi:hypothetical protein